MMSGGPVPVICTLSDLDALMLSRWPLQDVIVVADSGRMPERDSPGRAIDSVMRSPRPRGARHET